MTIGNLLMLLCGIIAGAYIFSMLCQWIAEQFDED